ncbi:MAG TPA: hypothetical protein PLA92_06915, partial [Fimbriimonadaceae bacterium]|nr:hypothetical protein [Fimbriimonadaceae bacterium]
MAEPDVAFALAEGVAGTHLCFRRLAIPWGKATSHGCHPKLALVCSGAGVENDWLGLHGCHP